MLIPVEIKQQAHIVLDHLSSYLNTVTAIIPSVFKDIPLAPS